MPFLRSAVIQCSRNHPSEWNTNCSSYAFDLSEVCGGNRFQYSLGIRRLQRIKVSPVLFFNTLADGKKFITNFIACQNHDLPRRFEVSVIIPAGFDITAFCKPCIIVF